MLTFDLDASRSEVDFRQPDGPTIAHYLPGLDVEVVVVEAAGTVREAQPQGSRTMCGLLSCGSRLRHAGPLVSVRRMGRNSHLCQACSSADRTPCLPARVRSVAADVCHVLFDNQGCPYEAAPACGLLPAVA